MELVFHKYSEEGNPLTKDYLNGIFEESLKDFAGKDKLQSDYEKLGWVRRSHYFDAFYMFSYAICICACSI